MDLPTPPFPLATAMMCSTPGTGCGPAGAAARLGLRSGGALGWAWAVMTAETLSTPGSARTRASASARAGSTAFARAGSTSMTKRTAPPSTESARTSPEPARSPPPTGSGIARSASSTASRVTLMPCPDPSGPGEPEAGPSPSLSWPRIWPSTTWRRPSSSITTSVRTG